MIPTSRGVTVYDDEGQRQIEVPVGRHLSGYAFEEMYDALVNQKPVIRDGRWGKATLEVQLAMVRSAQERREIQLKHQCPTPD
jgi:phthalate 4,5-cis-dihydrodiol dehydrogenase